MLKLIIAAAILAMASPAWADDGGVPPLMCGEKPCLIECGDAHCWRSGGIPTESPQVDRSWHLLTQSEGGTVSLLKDLTKHECEFAMHRAKGEPATDQEVQKAIQDKIDEEALLAQAREFCANPETPEPRRQKNCYQGVPLFYFMNHNHGGNSTQPGDIRSAECFQ